jgi:hypothetical protein
MKKIFSLLMFALLTMSAWAAKTVTLDLTAQGYTNGQEVTSLTIDGVTVTFDKGTNNNTPKYYTSGNAVRLYGGGSVSVSANETITGITFTFGSGDGSNAITCDEGTFDSPNWTGSATAVKFTIGGTTGHRRFAKIEVTIADATSDELVPPVFHPNGGEFTGSLEVSLTCATPNAEIQYYECDPVTHEIDWTTYHYYTEPFYVTETKTFAAFSSKSNEVSDYTYATFTNVLPTVANPTFTPASGTTFEDDLAIRIDCETEGATILYQVNNGEVEMDEAPIFLTLTETSTVTAIASKDGYNDSEEITATFTKVEPATGTCITFNSATDKGNGSSTETGPWTVEKNGVTIACTEGRVYDEGYRIYKDKTLTFTSNAGNITRIEFDGVTQSGYALTNFTTPTGTYYSTATSGLWIGEATEVVFTAGAQTRASEIRVYVDGEVVITIAAPSIPASQNFDESITVEITNNEEGATLMYAINDGEFTAYNEALTFTETTTLKAKAVKGEYESSVVTATYTKNEPTPEYTTLAEVNVIGNGKDFVFNGDAVVTAQKGAYLWLRDESGYGLIYGNINGQTNVKFDAGTVLSKGWTAKTKIYSGLMEYEKANNVSANGTNPTLAAIQTITELDTAMVNAYVQVLNVKSFAVDGRNVTATMSDGTTMVMYNSFDEAIPTEEGNYTVEGVVSTHNGMQLMILSIAGYVPEATSVNSIAEVYEGVEPGTLIEMYNDVVVTYHDTVGNRLFIRDTDDNSGMIYGELEGAPTFSKGDVLSDGWSATYAVYQNTPEFTNAQGIAASGDTREVAPFERNPEQIDIMNVHEYIVMKGQTVLPDNTNGSNSDKRFFIDLPNDSLVLFNQFNVELPTIEDGKTYDVTGIVTVYRGKAQVYILDMTEVADEYTRGDVDMDGFVKISDVTALVNYLLSNDATGIDLKAADTDEDTFIKISDVTTLINYLLSGKWE